MAAATNPTDWAVVYATIIGSIVGAIIAGGIGVFTTRYDRKLIRREKHLERHQDNLRIVAVVVNEVRWAVYPLWRLGHDGAQLPISAFLSKDPQIKNNWKDAVANLSKFAIGKFLIAREEMRGEIVRQSPNKPLYDDLNKHFKSLKEALDNYQELIRVKGSVALQSFYDVCEKIYDELSSNGFRTEFIGGSSPGTPRLKDELELAAQIVFNLSNEIDTKQWPNDFLKLTNDPDRSYLETYSNTLSSMTELKELVTTLKQISGSGDMLIDGIETILQETNITGRCSLS